ncbi:uncharacterized protein J3D65DRAFT_413892 [Phyllosticta citribraziliensis]|uniref:F-box domain-containing protein n=1 Tax=Phyllosticta citribraziliensis TaxID=989973 RepID=A0ABR1LP90_9PEZI
MVFRTLFYLSVLAVVVPTYSILRIPYALFDLIRRVSIVILEETEEKWDHRADVLWVREFRIWMTPNYEEDRLKEQARQKRQKEIVDKRNLSQSQLYRLPTELLCLIDNHLDPAGVRAIRATNSTLRDRLGMAKVERQDALTEAKPAKVQMSKWMIRQLYPRLCERERRVGAKVNGHDPRSGLYLCRPCAARHPFDSFSLEQIRAGPEKRRCLPQERVFHMCEHMTVDFNTVKDPIKRQEDTVTVPSRITCADCPKRLGASASMTEGMDYTILYERPDGAKWAKWYFRMRTMYPHKDVGKPLFSQLSAELACDKTPLCMHLEVRDLDFVTFRSRIALCNTTSDGFWGLCKICLARFSFHWRKDPVLLVLKIHYPIFVSGCGPTWLAVSKPSKNW